jgi:ankyrin repeat protein
MSADDQKGSVIVSVLVAAKANVGKTYGAGQTALFAACDKRRSPLILEALFAAGIDVNADVMGSSLVACLEAANGDYRCAERLMTGGYEVDKMVSVIPKESMGGPSLSLTTKTALSYFVEDEAGIDNGSVNFLLAHKSDINQILSKGSTLLITAIKSRYIGWVAFMLKTYSNVNPNAVDKEFRSPC